MPRRNSNTRGRSTTTLPRREREERPWWMRSGAKLHPKQYARLDEEHRARVVALGLAEEQTTSDPEPEMGTCPGCGEAQPAGFTFCSRGCRMAAFGLKDATCEKCSRDCEVPIAVPDEEARCGRCREKHRGYAKARV